MATRIEYYDYESFKNVLSQREYEAFTVLGEHDGDPGDKYEEPQYLHKTFYLDVISGIVVHDLARYENERGLT